MSQGAIADIAGMLQATRAKLEGLQSRSPAAHRLARLVGRLATRIARRPRIVLLGEFNSGKTTLANALIGADVLPTSFQANTRVPIHVHFAAVPSLGVEFYDGTRRPFDETSVSALVGGRVRMLHVSLNAARLELFDLIDTPGLASGDLRLDQMNLDACRRADIAIWCTASTQAWKATERAMWDTVPVRLHRKGLLVATLADALNTDRDRQRVEARLQIEAAPGFSGLAMVTAAEVDELRRNPGAPDHAERWVESGGAKLDAAVEQLLDQVWRDRRAAVSRILARSAGRFLSSGGPEARG